MGGFLSYGLDISSYNRQQCHDPFSSNVPALARMLCSDSHSLLPYVL